MTKSLPVAVVLSLLVFGVARRVPSDGVLQQMEAIFQQKHRSMSEAEVQSTIQRYEEQLKDIGTEEVLHEHGLDQTSESEEEAIVASAEGMLGNYAAAGETIRNGQAQEIVGHNGDTLEEVGATQFISDATKSIIHGDSGMPVKQAASQPASKKRFRESEAEQISHPYDTMDRKSVLSWDNRPSMSEAAAQNIIHQYEEKLEDIGANEVLHQYGLDHISEHDAEGLVTAIEGMVGDPTMVQSFIQRNVKQLEDIGTREVLHEHGLDRISESEAEAILTAAEGMIDEHIVGGKTTQAQEIVGHNGDMLEDVGATQDISDATKSIIHGDSGMPVKQAASQPASKKRFRESEAEQISHPYDTMDRKSVLSWDNRPSMSEAAAQNIIHQYEEKLEDIGANEVLHQYGLDQISEHDAEGLVTAIEGMVGDPTMVQSVIQRNVKQLEDIGTREVLHEHGLDRISESEAEAIVTAAEGMIEEHTLDGKTIGNNQAQKIQAAEETMLKEMHHEKALNYAAIGASKAPSQADSQDDAKPILLQFNSSSIHHMLCLQLRLCSQKEGALQKHKHGLSHVVHLDERQNTSSKSSSLQRVKQTSTEGLLKRAKHGLAHIMHLDGSESHVDKSVQGEGRFQRVKHGLAHILHLAGSREGVTDKVPSNFAKSFSENEARNARKIITEYNEHEKSFGEYDKVITDSEAQKIIGDYEKMLADFWDKKPVSEAKAQKTYSTHKQMHTEKRLDDMGPESKRSVVSERAIESHAPSALDVKKKTFDDLETIIGDIGSEKSEALYRDLLQSLAQNQDDVDKPIVDAQAVPPTNPAPAPAFPISFLQMSEEVTEKRVTKTALEAKSTSQTGPAVVNEAVTGPSHRDTVSVNNVADTSETNNTGLVHDKKGTITKEGHQDVVEANTHDQGVDTSETNNMGLVHDKKGSITKEGPQHVVEAHAHDQGTGKSQS